jgi:hypothetical protein
MFLNNYKELIDKLTKQKYSPLSENFYISIYFNTRKKTRSDIQTMLNSYINKAFDRKEILDGNDRLKKQVKKELKQILSGITGFENGLGIFIGLRLKDNDININIANLDITPENNLFVGKVYNLDQLLWTYHHNRELLILDIDKLNFNIYYLAGEKIEKLKHYENEFFETEEKEYQEVFTPVEGSSKVVFGKGERKAERRKAQTLIHFFDWAFNNLLEEEFFQEFDLKHLVIFHSSEYDEIVKVIKEQIEKRIRIEPILISRINTESVKIKEEISERIDQIKKNNKVKLLKAVKSKPEIFAQGWKEVTDSARLAKISTLFLKPSVKHKGYLVSNDMIYTYPVKGSMKLENIKPWLVMNVCNKGGEIRIITHTDTLSEEVSAKLRY